MTESKIYYRSLRNEHIRNQIFIWWARLHNDQQVLDRAEWQGNKSPLPRGVRAELHRCHSVDDVFLTEGFRALWFSLSEEQTRATSNMIAWATVAAVLADVRHTSEVPFAAALGSQKDKSGKPYVSELRFSQLQKSADPDAFLRRCRRAVALLDRKANVLSLADNILHWHQEKQGQIADRPNHRLAVRWATDYFTALAEYQK